MDRQMDGWTGVIPINPLKLCRGERERERNGGGGKSKIPKGLLGHTWTSESEDSGRPLALRSFVVLCFVAGSLPKCKPDLKYDQPLACYI